LVFILQFWETIHNSLQTGSAGAPVDFSIYNARGQLVRSFETTADAAGQAHLNWDGSNDNGSKVQSGVYYFRMSSSGMMKNGRIVLMK